MRTKFRRRKVKIEQKVKIAAEINIEIENYVLRPRDRRKTVVNGRKSEKGKYDVCRKTDLN